MIYNLHNSNISLLSYCITQESAHKESLQFYHSLRDYKDSYISSQINSALDTLLDALRLFGPSHVFSSYNGGKDADVIMHLLRAAIAKYSDDHGKPLFCRWNQNKMLRFNRNF
jgi:hypothetical protein